MNNFSNSFANQLPIWHFDDDLLVYSDGSLGKAFKLKGLDSNFLLDSAKNEFSQRLENLLNTSKEGLKLQVFYKLSDRNSKIINEHDEIGQSAGEFYKPIIKSRIKFFRENDLDKNLFSPEIYFFVRSSSQKLKKQKFWESDKQFQQITIDEYQKFKSDFLRATIQVKGLLSQASLDPKEVDKIEWFNLLYEYFNYERSELHHAPKLREDIGPLSEPLPSQFLLTDIDCTNQKYVKVGDLLFRAITLKTLPEGVSYATMVESFLKLPFHFWLSQSIEVHNRQKEISKLEVQRRIAFSMASGAKNVSDIESESKLAHLEELITELREGSENLVSCDFNVIVWAKDKEELEEKSDAILTQFRVLNQAEGVIETLPSKDAFIASLPGSCTIFREKKMKSSNCTHLMPVYDYWRGNSKPVAMVLNRDNVPFAIDPYSDELPCWNGLVIGGTGSGKVLASAYFNSCKQLLTVS